MLVFALKDQDVSEYHYRFYHVLAMLAACAKSSSNGSISGTSGAFGSVPAATGTAHAGTITSAEPPGSAPNWILPIEPSANASVYSSFSFSYEMVRPLYWYVNGVAP